MSRGGTDIKHGLLWSMQKRKIKTKGIREQDSAECRKTQDKNTNHAASAIAQLNKGRDLQ